MQIRSHNSKNIKSFKKGYSDCKTETFMYTIDYVNSLLNLFLLKVYGPGIKSPLSNNCGSLYCIYWNTGVYI